ncbi:MAG: hypothetical protein LBI29_00320 [Rickettsiales bacterium]|jgi:uncharacterized integral membrane protein|nr:hypothetical protein [Rickettsiales bacterium]
MIKGFYNLLKLALFFLLFMLCVAFALNNADFVKLNLSPLNYVLEVRLFMLMLLSGFLGSLLALFFSHIRRFFSLFDFGRMYSLRRIRVLENELKKLQTRCDRDKLKTSGENETRK